MTYRRYATYREALLKRLPTGAELVMRAGRREWDGIWSDLLDAGVPGDPQARDTLG